MPVLFAVGRVVLVLLVLVLVLPVLELPPPPPDMPLNLGYIVVVVPFLALQYLLLLVYLVNPVDFVLPTPTLVAVVLVAVNLLEHEGRVVVEVVEVLRVLVELVVLVVAVLVLVGVGVLEHSVQQ
jgi:hypothetical protein